MIESNILRTIMLRVSKIGTTIFRCNTGVGWVGKSQRISAPTTVKLNIGDVVIRDARPLHAGLTNGGSDLIGWTPISVTAAMVGRRIAVFTAIEAKADTDPAIEQVRFIEAVQEAGGIAGVARSADDAARIVTEFLGRRT